MGKYKDSGKHDFDEEDDKAIEEAILSVVREAEAKKAKDVPPETGQEVRPTKKRTDRQGRVAMPFWTTAAARKQLKIMAAEMETTQQELMIEALNDFFKKHNKNTLA